MVTNILTKRLKIGISSSKKLKFHNSIIPSPGQIRKARRNSMLSVDCKNSEMLTIKRFSTLVCTGGKINVRILHTHSSLILLKILISKGLMTAIQTDCIKLVAFFLFIIRIETYLRNISKRNQLMELTLSSETCSKGTSLRTMQNYFEMSQPGCMRYNTLYSIAARNRLWKR